jgi:uncharacterized membrane protein YraQ (UPF0718 family)
MDVLRFWPRIAQTALVVALTALFAFAPLICVRLCALRAASHSVHAMTTHDAHAAHGAHVIAAQELDAASYTRLASASRDDARPGALLDEMQALLRALIEFVVIGTALVYGCRVFVGTPAIQTVLRARTSLPLLRPPRRACVFGLR